jgi:molybdopterin-guanine dinucleotide biosynthesis adapter protein
VTTIGIVGRKNNGKTHLVVRLVAEFRRRGLTVSTIKHTHHHDVEPDAPGKDSFRHREAGAAEVLVASDRRWYLVHESRDESPPELAALLARLAPCDLVLVEGYKDLTTHPRIEVFRPAATPSTGPLAADDPGILAVASPAAAAAARRGTGAAISLDLDDTAGIADFILALRP